MVHTYMLTCWSYREVTEVQKWVKDVAAYPHQVEHDLKDQSGSVQRLVTDESY